MGVVSISLQKKKLTHRVYTPIREFLVDSRAVGVILIARTIFSLTLSFLPVPQSAFNSFSQQPLAVGVVVIAALVLGKAPDAWFCRVKRMPAAQ